MEHGESATQQDIKWLDDLIKAERRQVKNEKAEKAEKTGRSTSRRRSSSSSSVAKERAG
jgi:hypothetical protein